MTDSYGPWHAFSITEDDDGEREHTILCPPECPERCVIDEQTDWDNFESFDIPESELPPGTHRIRFWASSTYVPRYGVYERDYGINVEPAGPPPTTAALT
ncbi:hypothetical protein ABTX81_30255 [Kitasatospora sp. NPDC097605]|uniref:hypothetical protein n=1 Tax=Kitasatospora sp. NPDC097605 TaxID=3157226 RepID=UPI00331B9CF0